MIARTQGIRRTAPVKWRSFETMCGVFWEAEGSDEANGYYCSPDPRILLFFSDVSQHIGMSYTGPVKDPLIQPLARAIYVPAGTQLWTKFGSKVSFSHLDIHLKEAWLHERLNRDTRGAVSLDKLLQFNDINDDPQICVIGEALKHAICSGDQHPVVSESLTIALAGAMLAPKQDRPNVSVQNGGLTPSQMKRLIKRVEAHPAKRFLNAEFAEEVGLSPSWFAHAFKITTGKSPLQWQQERRVAAAKQRMLLNNDSIAETASVFGFADQAHFTRVFRQVTGTTPAAWMRESRRLAELSSDLVSDLIEQT